MQTRQLLRRPASQAPAACPSQAAPRARHESTDAASVWFDFASLSVNGAPLRRKLAVGSPHDAAESEADRVAEHVMRMPETGPVLQRACVACEKEDEKLHRKETGAGPAEAPGIVEDVVSSGGSPLDAATRAFMEPRFGHDFSRIRVHTDARAAQSASAVNARAYTVGSDIVFGGGTYAPHSQSGRALLAHELAHTIQQGSSAARPVVRRELMAYNAQHTEMLPTGPEETGVTSIETSGDAATVRTALNALINAGKVATRTFGGGTIFTNRSATRNELELALASFAPRSAMVDALLNEHNLYLYAHSEVTRYHGLFSFEMGRRTDIAERQVRRPLTAQERTEARIAFGTSLDLDAITLVEDELMSTGGYIRTTPAAIYGPPGFFNGLNFPNLLIHELTHSWQYQHGVSLATTTYHAIFSTYYYGDEAGLLAAAKAGKHFKDFNTEQQGDIVEDYYKRVKSGQPTTAWLPFIKEVQHP